MFGIDQEDCCMKAFLCSQNQLRLYRPQHILSMACHIWGGGVPLSWSWPGEEGDYWYWGTPSTQKGPETRDWGTPSPQRTWDQRPGSNELVTPPLDRIWDQGSVSPDNLLPCGRTNRIETLPSLVLRTRTVKIEGSPSSWI